ncbi:MAG TPA: hypothetical protein VMH22_05540 [bacterium]|nr:hypothetical protein [bacterium]
MINAKPMVIGVIALALLAWTGALHAEEATAPADNNVDTEAGNVGGMCGGIAVEDTGAVVNSVTGWVVDASCWLGLGARGEKHQQCAVACANMGTPLVILTDRGTVIYPVMLTAPASPKENNAKLIPFAEQRVTVTGRVIKRGQERGIVIDTVATAPEPEKPVSFAGRETANVQLVARVSDLSCWIGKGEHGTNHAECAQACAQAGEPLVLVNDSGYIYYPVTQTMPSGPADNARLMNYCEQEVQVTGKIIQRGRERAVVIDKVAAYAPMPKPGSTGSGK